jgi:hypothetical protein
MTRQQILEELQQLYQKAWNQKAWSCALQIKKLEAQILGLLKPKILKTQSLQSYTDEELHYLLDQLNQWVSDSSFSSDCPRSSEE